MDGLRLRKASVTDCGAFHRMQLAAFKPLLDRYQDFDISPGAESIEYVRRRFDVPGIDHYFIELDGESIGCVRIREVSADARKLTLICVLPERQGHGCAQEAIRLAEALYPQAARWTLETIKQEPKLRHLYEKLGYRPTGEETPVKDGMDLVGYEK